MALSLWGNPADGLVGMEAGLAPAWNKEVAVRTDQREFQEQEGGPCLCGMEEGGREGL